MNKQLTPYQKNYLAEKYKEVALTSTIINELPCTIEVLNCLGDRFYRFNMNKGKIVYGMFVNWVKGYCNDVTDYILDRATNKLYKEKT